MKKLVFVAASAVALAGSVSTLSSAQSQNPYVGDMIMMAGDYCPDGWLKPEGQSLPIADNENLFEYIGTTFGGDGDETFALPDMRGRIPLHYGQGIGLSSFTVGQQTGSETVQLFASNLPYHRHFVFANSRGTTVVSPDGASLTNFTTPGAAAYGYAPDTDMDDDIIGITGESDPFSVISPTVALQYCINTNGSVPQRN